MTINLKEKVGIVEAHATQMWIRSRLGRHIRVVFSNDATTAFVERLPDGTLQATFPTPNSNMTLRDRIRARGLALHEYGHPRWQPEIFDVMHKYPTRQGSPLGGIYNILADVHSETLTSMEYPGDAKALSEFAAVVGRDVTDKLERQLKAAGNVFPPEFAKMASVMVAARNAESTWNVGMHVGFDKLVNKVYTQDIRDKAEELEAKFDLTSLLVHKPDDIDEWEIWELSKRIYEWMWDKDPESEIGGSGGEGKGSGEDSKEGEPKDGETEGESNGTSNGSGGKAKDGKDDPEPLKEKIKIDELLFSNHYESMKTGGGGTGVGFDYSEYTKHDVYTPVDPATFIVVKFGKGNKRE